jgi:trans-aconitate methyltransferase
LSMQKWNADQYAENVRFVSDLGGGVIDLLAPKAGERILDLGCGDGPFAAKLMGLGCDVVAVDASPEMIATARQLGLDARVADGQCLAFEDEFDAVFSNAALHWMPRYRDVVAGVRRALKPAGRFVAEFGGGHNVKTIVDALAARLGERGIDATQHNPWYFPGPDEYRAVLGSTGFDVTMMELFERPTPLPGDIVGWLETFAQTFTSPLPVTQRRVFLEEVRETLRPVLCDQDGNWTADYVRLRIFAQRLD